MGKTNTEASISNESLDETPKDYGIMSDTTYAQELLQEAFQIRAGRNIKAAIGEAFEALKRRERKLPKEVLAARERQWTERRVKAIWGGKEARRIDHYEIEDLTAIAVEEARIERARGRARDARLAALIAAADTGAHRPMGQRKGRVASGLDLS